jgi:hypothetical protein
MCIPETHPVLGKQRPLIINTITTMPYDSRSAGPAVRRDGHDAEEFADVSRNRQAVQSYEKWRRPSSRASTCLVLRPRPFRR